IGTRSTIKSGSYKKCICGVSPGTKLFGRSCPLFVPLVENRMIDDPVTREMATRYLSPLKRNRIDTLILGCTHYPVLKEVISSALDDVELVDSSQAVAKAVRGTLKDLDLMSDRRSGGTLRCYVSDDEEGFKKTAGIFLGSPPAVRKASL
ncbi:MAG: glutamate racemase, partial [Candidatus Omnitrophica bacterium]|nr:glutamate racemase [Candidatus Omnitrophota bacterium]